MPSHIFTDFVPVAHLTQHARVHEAGFDDFAAIDHQFRLLRHSRLVKVVETKLGWSHHYQAQGVAVDGDTQLFPKLPCRSQPMILAARGGRLQGASRAYRSA